MVKPEHKQRYLNDLRAADQLLAKHMGPLTLIRKELRILIGEVETWKTEAER
jgi:hypothetical protein